MYDMQKKMAVSRDDYEQQQELQVNGEYLYTAVAAALTVCTALL